MLYRILSPIVKKGFQHFFSHIEVHGKENWPAKKPLILVANHQNAMLDPVVICVHAPVTLNWLTRADVFKNPKIDWLLRKMHMLPVYRERDKVGNLHSINQITFDEVNKRLIGESTICIFPEGTHRGKKQLHHLKKGVARMAHTAYLSGVKDLCIIPVGLDYEDFYNYQKKLLITIGKPIPVASFFEGPRDDARQQQRLLQVIKTELSKVMVNIHEEDWYNDLMALRPFSDSAAKSKILSEQFDHYQNTYTAIQQDEGMRDKVFALLQKTLKIGNDIGLKESRLQLSPGSAMVWWILLAVPALIGMVCWYPLFAITESTQKKIVKDPLFKNSIRLVFWTFGGIIWWLILVLGSRLFTLSWSLSIGFAMAGYLCGIAGLFWLRQNQSVRNFFRTYQVKQSHPDEFAQWMKLREELISIIS